MRAEDVEVYEKYADELIRFASMLVGADAAEDVLIAAVVRTFDSPRWPEVADRRGYLYRAVLNEARDTVRATRRRAARERRTASDEVVLIDLLGVEVVDAVRKLSLRQRAVVFLTYWGELSAAEVAAELGLGRRTVERELAAARRRLEVLLR